MDQKLRELERKAQDDPQAALQLAAALKRLLSEQWQAVPCNTWEPPAVRGYRHERCQDCHGMEFMRINVATLNECVPPKDRSPMPKPRPAFTTIPGPMGPPGPPGVPGAGYGALPNNLANHYDDQ
jgi:hypothetical protein